MTVSECYGDIKTEGVTTTLNFLMQPQDECVPSEHVYHKQITNRTLYRLEIGLTVNVEKVCMYEDLMKPKFLYCH